MKAVWPGVFVTDDSLVQCVRDVRRAIGDADQSVLSFHARAVHPD